MAARDPTTEEGSLAITDLLRRAADRSGFVPFDRFMEIALYAPEVGYYNAAKSPLGTGGDFYTAAHASPLFAAAIAQRIRKAREQVRRPARFSIVELGPGDGRLGAGIAAALIAEAERYEYVLVERSDRRAEESLTRIHAAAPTLPVRRESSVGALGPFDGVVIANEYLDAQPARRLQWTGSAWRELGAEVRDGRLSAAERPVERRVPGPALPTPDEAGVIVEISPAAEATVREIGDHLDAGAALLIDYGLEESELLRGHPRGTLAAVRGHRSQDDPFDAPGSADLSVFVNFTRVRSVARSSGFTETAFRSQAEALGDWGVPGLLEQAVRSAGSAEAEVRVRLAAKNLLFGFDRFRALELEPPTRPAT